MIFGFNNYAPNAGAMEAQPLKQRGERACAADVQSAEPDRSQLSKAQIYDLDHERKLRALHTLMENGASLSEAARRIGVSHLCAHRWNDYGRR